MAVELAFVSAVAQGTGTAEDGFLQFLYGGLVAPEDPAGVVVLVIAAVNLDPQTAGPLNIEGVSFAYGALEPTGSEVSGFGALEDSVYVGYAYAYWLMPPDAEFTGDVNVIVTGVESDTAYRYQIFVFSGVESVSAASNSGTDGEINATFSAPGELPDGSAVFTHATTANAQSSGPELSDTAGLEAQGIELFQSYFGLPDLEAQTVWSMDTGDTPPPTNVFFALRALLSAPEASMSTDFNCACDDENPAETLAQLRRRLLVRLGYAAQADSPPPGMALLLDDFLQSSQRYLYRKYNALRTERFFEWTMNSTDGIRFYDLVENEDECTKRMDVYKVSWVGISDVAGANDTWLPLIEGIPPEFYTSANRPGIPTRYEIRQCIEVFPAPDRDYKLRIKAHFGIEAFADDDDQATIDSELLFMWALGTAKAHYGQPDAADVKAEAADYLKQLIKGTHGTARYVPGSMPVPSATPPRFLDQEG